MKGLTIGKLAKRADIGIETVRFYEKQGLIDPPPRTASNYRIYPEEDALKLRFIKRAELKIVDIKEKISALGRMLTALEHLTGECDGHGALDDCPILKALVDDTTGKCQHH